MVLSLLGCNFSDSPKLELKPPTGTQRLYEAAKKSNWLVTISIVGIAIGVFATFNGYKWGIGGIVSCCVSLFMALAVARFATWMAIIGMLGSTGACVISVLVRKKALVEIIKGVQNYRKAPAFEPTSLDMELNAEQSSTTKKIVKAIKGKM
jgi:hypothetical protein